MTKPVDAICEQQNADQPAHPRSLQCDLFIRCIDSMIQNSKNSVSF